MARAPSIVDRNFEAILNRMEKRMAERFRAAIRGIANAADQSALQAAIERGDTAGVLRAVGMSEVFFYDLDRAIDEAYYEGATREGNLIKGASGNAMEVRFNGRHRRAETFVRETGARLVVEVTRQTQESIRQIVERGLQEGRNPRDVSLDIIGRIPKGSRQREGGIIGLTTQESGWVMNARRELETGDASFLERKARNRRADAMLRQLFAAGKAPTQQQINSIISDYSDKLLQLRGERIARTEAIRALNAGRYEMSRQLVESGQMPREAVKYIWDATLSKRTRDSHLHLNGEEVGFDEPFRSPITGALLRFPGDVSLGAPGSETINCRCTMRTRIDRKMLATKKPRGRPVGSTNRPRVGETAPPPSLPPVAPPAPAGRQPFTYPSPRDFTTKQAIDDYIREHDIATAIQWREDQIADDDVPRIRRRAAFVIRTHEVVERFSLPPIPVIGDISDVYLAKNPGTGAYVSRSLATNQYTQLRLNPETTKPTYDSGVFQSSTDYAQGIGGMQYRNQRKLPSIQQDDDLRSRYERRESMHWTISQEYRDTSYVHDVAFHEGGHLVHFSQHLSEIEQIMINIDWGKWSPLLSGYAGTNHMEYVAEAFNLYMRGEDNEYYRIHPNLLAWFYANDRRRNTNPTQ